MSTGMEGRKVTKATWNQPDRLNLFCKLVLSQDQFGDTGTLIIDLVRVRLEARLDRFTYVQ